VECDHITPHELPPKIRASSTYAEFMSYFGNNCPEKSVIIIKAVKRTKNVAPKDALTVEVNEQEIDGKGIEVRQGEKIKFQIGTENIRQNHSTHLTIANRYMDEFRYVQEYCLPEIINRKLTNGDRTIRAWVIGCSTGEEARTFVRIFRDAFADHPQWGNLTDWDIQAIGTDFNSDVLNQARGHDGFWLA